MSSLPFPCVQPRPFRKPRPCATGTNGRVAGHWSRGSTLRPDRRCPSSPVAITRGHRHTTVFLPAKKFSRIAKFGNDGHSRPEIRTGPAHFPVRLRKPGRQPAPCARRGATVVCRLASADSGASGGTPADVRRLPQACPVPLGRDLRDGNPN
jgi:hypothetical protein